MEKINLFKPVDNVPKHVTAVGVYTYIEANSYHLFDSFF